MTKQSKLFFYHTVSIAADTPPLTTFLTVQAEDADLNSDIEYTLFADNKQRQYFAMNQEGELFTRIAVTPVSYLHQEIIFQAILLHYEMHGNLLNDAIHCAYHNKTKPKHLPC